MRGLAHSVNEADLERVEKSFEVLNSLLDGKEFAAGDDLTIADFAVSTTICTVLVSPAATRRTMTRIVVARRGSGRFFDCSASTSTSAVTTTSPRITSVARRIWRNSDSRRCTPWVLKCLPRCTTRTCKNLVNVDMAMDICARLK